MPLLGHARRLAATAIVAAALLGWWPVASAPAAVAGPAAAPPAAAPPAPAPDPAPLTNEDVVRLVIHGTAESVIVREIAVRPPDFDLDPGVVAELEHVGVSRTIIEAMRRRQIDAGIRPEPGAPPPPEPSTTTPPPAADNQGTVVVAFAPAQAGDPPAEIFAIAARPKGAPRPDDGEIGLVTDLALVLACTTSTHVPDHWDTRTPLEGAPRHEILLFHPGSHHRDQHGFDLLVLDRDEPAPIRLAAGRHALIAGLAGRHGSGAWRLIASDGEAIDVAAGATVRLRLDARAALRGSRMTGYRIEQVFTLAPGPAPPTAGDPPAGVAPGTAAAPATDAAPAPGVTP